MKKRALAARPCSSRATARSSGQRELSGRARSPRLRHRDKNKTPDVQHRRHPNAWCLGVSKRSSALVNFTFSVLVEDAAKTAAETRSAEDGNSGRELQKRYYPTVGLHSTGEKV